MFKKILFPTDFSDVSKKAMKYIKQLRGAGAQEVIVFHVIDDKEMLVLSRMPAQYPELKTAINKEVANELAAVDVEMRAEGFKVKLEVKTGQPFKEIMDLAEKKGVSIIVLGSHGKSNIAEMLMGSVSENVIRHARVPVLVVSR